MIGGSVVGGALGAGGGAGAGAGGAVPFRGFGAAGVGFGSALGDGLRSIRGLGSNPLGRARG